MLTIDEILDVTGLSCPLPLLKAKQALNRLAPGAILKVDCTDAGSVRDFQVFAKQSGHSLIEQQEQSGHYIHWLKKA
jgi:TusA-related sulfurtransferase